MRRSIPSLALLQAFEACSRHLSVSRAAEELCLTQSAVSRQIAQLEAVLQVALFLRVRKRLEPTPEGMAYVEEIRSALAHIESATIGIREHGPRDDTLCLAVPPTLGARWIVPRLASLRAAAPHVSVSLVNHSSWPAPSGLPSDRIDAAIIFAPSVPAGFTGHRLFEEELVPVCAPHLIAEGRLRRGEDLAGQVLLQNMTRPDAWPDWLAQNRIEGVDGRRGPAFQHMAMVTEAAAAGLGVAIMARLLVTQDIEAGRLAVPFERPVFSRQSYYFTYAPEMGGRRALVAVRDWLIGEAAVVDHGRGGTAEATRPGTRQDAGPVAPGGL